MRAALVFGVIVGSLSTAYAVPTLDVARADAQKAGRALVIELGATWCGPCRAFERDVLPAPEVIVALTTVSFVRYDGDVAPGDAVAQQLRVTAFPTFLIIDPVTGAELERVTGLAPNGGTLWFVQLVERARNGTARARTLTAAVAAHSDDPVALIALAEYERSIGQTLEAIGHFSDAQQSPRADAEITARARDAIHRLDEAERRQRGLGGDLSFVSRRPGSPRASAALLRLAMSSYVSRARLRELATSHLLQLKPNRWTEVADAVHVGMLLADHRTTVDTARGWFKIEPANPAMKLMMAEIALFHRDFELATNDTRRICHPWPPPGFELQCYALRVAVAAQQSMPPGLIHAMETTRAQLEGAVPDRWRDLQSLADFGAFGVSLVEILGKAAAKCGDTTTYAALVTLDLDIERGTERLRVLAIHGPHEAPLDACLRAQLTGTPMSGRPPGVTAFGVPLVIEERPPTCATCRSAGSTPVPTGGVAYATMSTGALVSRGVGAAGLLDIGPIDPMRFFVGADARAGVTADEKASYAAHALLGLGGGTTFVFQLITGVGVSRHGDTEPLAVDVPIEVRLSVLARRFHYQAWGRGTVLIGEPSRQMQRLGGDELAIGLGFSLPIASVRVFAGAELGLSVTGTTSVFRLGIPIGAGY